MEKFYHEKRGSWLWTVNVDFIGGSVAVTGLREKDDDHQRAIEFRVWPAEATGLGQFSNLGLATLIGWLGGSKVRRAFGRAFDLVKSKL